MIVLKQNKADVSPEHPPESDENAMYGQEMLVPIKEAAPSRHEKRTQGEECVQNNINNDNAPLAVQTSSGSCVNSLGSGFDIGFGDDDDEEVDSFQVDGVKPVFVGTPFNKPSSSSPSVKDMIKQFGGSPAQRGSSGDNNNNNSGSTGSGLFGGLFGRRTSLGSVQSNRSNNSRHTDTPLGTSHSFDDCSSTGSFTSLPVHYEPSGSNSSPNQDKTQSELDLLREQSIVSSRRKTQRRSAARRDRLHYKLGSGRKGMTDKDLRRSRSFLPADKLIEMKQQQQQQKPPDPQKKNPTAVTAGESEMYVWLMSPTTKVFEIVRVHYNDETTIGDVLVLARAAALDPVLAEQRYVSLCNERMELVAPALPITFLFDSKHKNNSNGSGSSHSKPSLMAVPDGSTALLVREIQKALLTNRRVRKWLKQEDIFRPLTEEEKRRKRLAKQKKKTSEKERKP